MDENSANGEKEYTCSAKIGSFVGLAHQGKDILCLDSL